MIITRRSVILGTGAVMLAGCDSLTDNPALLSADEAHRFLQRSVVGRAALARRYGVPVHRSEVPTRALASLLGADADALRHGEHGEVDALLTARMPDWADRWEARRRKAEAAAARRPWWSTLGRWH